MKLRTIFCAITGLIVPAASAADAPATPPRAQNVILIIADDLGYADVGFHGQDQFKTPHIDSLAAEGVQFSQGYVTENVCGPTRAGMLTGRYQQQLGAERNVGPRRRTLDVPYGLPLEHKLIADRIKEQDIAKTAIFGKWHLGGEHLFDQRLFPLSRGFDEFFGFLEGAALYDDVTNREEKYMRGNELVEREEEYYTDAIGRESISFIERHKDEPFFLYVAFNAPHAPMQAKAEALERVKHIEDPNRRILAAMIETMDDNIGRILDTLEKNDLTEKTMIVFLSDNGGKPNNNFSINDPLRGEKGTYYEGGIRVPFVIKWPGVAPAGEKIDDMVFSLDLFPTIYNALGGEVDESWKLEGINLAPHLGADAAAFPRRTLFWKTGNKWAVNDGKWKLVKEGGEMELFNLDDDLAESNNLIHQNPEIADRLLKAHQKWDDTTVPPNYGWDPKLPYHSERVKRK
ncbi:sulfatase-like hydrolase/transferase [Persicirhabdus sediminis]|uniref:Sulfatase-like hydrolase/transferase n=1 Tax=Persicirhabdus sediminis TaxID=454144 RepID=A0A8J7SIP7_9BACT|nr:sulfatase-like hydrolase/transferase [Persicirhabdus sediminis]MBK1789700.1 sulfatase-like hydrolase/transferase [Persicirhabdus sediminis]